jgi:Dyp-type peroxidase family
LRLDLDEIQGDITPGFRKDWQDFVFLFFDDGGAAPARQWLARLHPALSSARRVIEYNRGHRAWKKDYADWTRASERRQEPPLPMTRCVNVAFSYRGLQRLEVRDLGGFPSEFVADPQTRARRIGDEDSFERWEIGGPNSEPDALLILGADTSADLDALRADPRVSWEEHGMRAICERGNTLGRGREHFGFKDGLSQPDPHEPSEDGWSASVDGQIAAPGEFILGQPNALGSTDVVGPDWARNGSYAVFRKLEQHVYLFRATMFSEAMKRGMRASALAAKLVGRRKDGVRLDALGEGCPLFAHIQQANPRDRPEVEPNRHRIIRRGIPYGSPARLRDAAADDDGQRGLLFLAYQASIRDQFEHILTRWMNDSTFPPPRTASGFRPSPVPTAVEVPGWDPLVGTFPGSKTHQVSLHTGRRDAFDTVELPELVTTRGGAYFFSPSISAVRRLAARAC